MRRYRLPKKLAAIVLCGALLIPAGAMAGETVSNETISLADYENYIKSTNNITTRSTSDNLSIQAFSYMEAATDEAALSSMLEDYHDVAGTREKTYEMFEANLNGTYQEVEANDFNQEQAAQLLESAADLETGNAEVTEFTPVDSDEIPAPPHSNATIDTSNSSISLLSNSDISTARDGEASGLGYEVKSLSGYNRTTADCYPGDCNIGDNADYSGGIAGYMFYTIAGGGGVQDLGIGYAGNGYWQPVVNGTWTGWATGPARIANGQKLYFKIWIGTDQKIYFQGLDGNNFSNVLFQGVYDSWGMLPANGSGVTINRQITYAANAGYRNDHTGLYVKNARFDAAYLYNDYSYAQFNNSNTDSTRRGKFGASWAPYSQVAINSNTHWYSENVTINLD